MAHSSASIAWQSSCGREGCRSLGRGCIVMVVFSLGALLAAPKDTSPLWHFALSYHWQLAPVLIFIISEASFYILWYQKRFREWNAQPEVHAPSRHEALQLFNRFLELQSGQPEQRGINAYFSIWFRGAPFHSILRGNVEELMAYGFWYKSR
jgi:hypothetical protein